MQHVSFRPFAILITVSDEENFNQALLLSVWWSHASLHASQREAGPTPSNRGGADDGLPLLVVISFELPPK